MARRRRKKDKMNEKVTATKTNDRHAISSKADLCSDEEMTTNEMTDQNTEYTEPSAAEL